MKTLTGIVGSLALGVCACGADDPLSSTHFSSRVEGLGPAVDPAAPAELETPTPALEPAPGVQLRWRSCGSIGLRDIRCAEVDVPLDYDAPDGEQLPIAINRVERNPAVHRRGVLFFNPGGPGASGKQAVVDLARAGYFDLLAPGFDIVGFDPRGVAESGDRACGLPLDLMLPYAARGGLSAGMDEISAAQAAEGRRCASTWGPLFNELGSNQVVKDMNRLRQALEQPVLNYLGISYGTRLGALYAHEFPETSGAIVLDAIVNPTVDVVQDVREGFLEMLELHEAFFSDCERGALPCPPEARSLFEALLADAEALELAPGIVSLWGEALSSPPGRDELVTLLERQLEEPDSAWILDVVGRGTWNGVAQVPLVTVNCIDAAEEPPTAADVEALFYEFEAQEPTFASYALSAGMCMGWPVTRDPTPLPVATDAPPILAIGGTQDWLTPFVEAEAMTEALGNAVLLTSNHFGHSGVIWGSDCVRSAVRSFFTDGTLPAEGSVCD